MFKFLSSLFSKPADETETPAAKPVEAFDSPVEIFALFTRVTGMHFHKKEAIAAEKIKNFARRREIFSFHELRRRLESEPALMQELIDHLTVNETFFFRELEQISILEQLVREHPGGVRILCAPCASGEEVYSIIIRLLEAGVAPERFRILGIDINAEAITRAREGRYSARAVNRLDSETLGRYFLQEGPGYRIAPRLREMAEFRVENIFEGSFLKLGEFDFIFSRNLFIYFDEEEKRRAIDGFCRLLKPGARIFFGHADNFEYSGCLRGEFIGRSRVYTRLS